MVLFCGAKQFKPELHVTFTHLCKDPHFIVRKTISGGFHEVRQQYQIPYTDLKDATCIGIKKKMQRNVNNHHAEFCGRMFRRVTCLVLQQVCKLLGNTAQLIQADVVALLKDESIEVNFTTTRQSSCLKSSALILLSIFTCVIVKSND
jgi:hypothetical protein